MHRVGRVKETFPLLPPQLLHILFNYSTHPSVKETSLLLPPQLLHTLFHKRTLSPPSSAATPHALPTTPRTLQLLHTLLYQTISTVKYARVCSTKINALYYLRRTFYYLRFIFVLDFLVTYATQDGIWTALLPPLTTISTVRFGNAPDVLHSLLIPGCLTISPPSLTLP